MLDGTPSCSPSASHSVSGTVGNNWCSCSIGPGLSSIHVMVVGSSVVDVVVPPWGLQAVSMTAAMADAIILFITSVLLNYCIVMGAHIN